MKTRQMISMLCALLLALPVLAHAETYKWKDKNGVIQYTDTPPPSNIKQELFGRKKAVKPTGREPLSKAISEPQTPAKDPNKVAGKDEAKASAAAAKEKADLDAKKRQQQAEVDKLMKQEKEAQAKAKQDNCNAAKANFETYNQGGKVFKVTEKGERVYMGDKDIEANKDKASKEISQYCN